MAKSTTDADRELLDQLGVDTTPVQLETRTREEERIIAGFEEIERFVEEHGRVPRHREDRDIFERLYAVRLDRLRESEEYRALLMPLDHRGILDATGDGALSSEEELTDEALLASLGVEAATEDEITQLTHVRSRQEIKAAEEVAQRTRCQDFDEFEPVFAQVQHDLDTGVRHTVKYQDDAAVRLGDLFILEGHKVMVARIGDEFTNDYGRPDRRLRVIYDNATESDLLLRSLQRALNKDKASRRITTPDLGPLFSQDEDSQSNLENDAEPRSVKDKSADYIAPLFSDIEEADDLLTGSIYVLQSRSDHPFLAQHRELIHKIGVTSGDIEKRLANAKKDPTYLFADVDVVARVKLAHISPRRMEALLHRFFKSVQLDVELQDRFDMPVKPKEWFLVPLHVIEEAIEKITDGTIEQFRYDRDTARVIRL